MADALVSIALLKIANAIRQQLDLFAGAADELEKLRHSFQSVQTVLHDAERRQVAKESVRLWWSKLRNVSYDITDVLDDWEISRGIGEEEEGDDDEGDGRNKACACLFAPYNSFYRVVSRYNAARRIKEIRERLDQIDGEITRFRFVHSIPVRCSDESSFLEASEMTIGMENDQEIIISRLVSGSSIHEEVGGQVHVVAVVGTGGLGKTTLVWQIYHDGRVRDHFNMFLWVCASGVFDVIRLTKDVLEQVKRTRSSLSELDSLQNQLLQELRGKHFLLVLDDVWNDDEENWEMLRFCLNSGAQGSRILVTTRSEVVAIKMNATYIHKLKGLSMDDSWALFSSRAFAGRKAEEYCVSESAREEIVYSCRGVPAVIEAIGSYMHSQRNEVDWESTWDWRIGYSADLSALLFTYLNFPAHLQQCFEYCSTFPEGWEFKKDSLVRLWIAQDFILPRENRDIENLGAEYFDELVAWLMFERIPDDGETRYKMRHDFAEFILKDDIDTFVGEGQWLSRNFHHAFLSFADNDDKPSKIPIAASRATKLRTLWLDGIDRSDQVIVDILRQAKSLRALSLLGFKSSEKAAQLTDGIWKMRHLRYLDLSSSDIVELPHAIGNMRHLRYLDFSSTNIVKLPNVIGKMKYLKYLNLSCLNIVELPESVSHLRNLHTLNLTGCEKLKRLPRGMGKMVSLTYLEIERTDSLESLPKGLGRINGLRRLCKFMVGGGEEGGCQIDELQRLNYLQGILRIQHLERVSSLEEAGKAELWNKPHLRGLVLSMFGRDDADIERTNGVLEGLRPHENLEELKLFWYTGSKLPSWMMAMPRLLKLQLCGCPNLEGLLHHVSEIPELMIRACPRIKGIAGSSSMYLEKISVIGSSEFFSSGLPHLPTLRTFEIRSFTNGTLPDGGWEQLVALETLEIWNCSELKSLPDGLTQLPSLEKLIIYGCDKLERLPEGLGQLKKLRSLTIGVLKALTCLPDSLEQLRYLQHLDVSSCKKLESLPNGLQQLYLPSLRTFEIRGFINETLPAGGWEQLVALETLEIRNCSQLKSLPDGLTQLPSLQNLIIYGCDKLEGLPEEWGQLKKLTSLTVGALKALRCLPDSLEQLESLEHLEVSSCKKLVSLPDGLQHLYLLSQLSICGCPLLSERCKREGGVDWHRISHISNIEIDKQRIR